MNKTTETTNGGKTLRGIVVKAAMTDTATVSVRRFVKHPKYKKYLTREKCYLVHNAGNKARVGDAVVIRETRPISKLKHFTIESISPVPTDDSSK
ncbi:MAG: 30S ribosomal protein S17 [Patescibacteria group bacterium]